MAITLGPNNYGKSEVRLVKVVRGAERHELHDLTVDVSLEGDFAAAHEAGDNSGLTATDTMCNTVYALAQQHPVDQLETFARTLAKHFVATGPKVTHARVSIVAHPWARIGAHPHAFQGGNGGRRVAVVRSDGERAEVEAGIDDLLVLKTTGSGWAGFHRDRYTTLPDTDERILATLVTARWRYVDGAETDWTAAWTEARDAILATLGDHFSPSVQFTLQRMGTAVLEARPEIERIHLSLPNKHHLLRDLERFGLPNEGEIYHATSEPYGVIEGTVERTPEP
jgi:urate oxidase